MAYGYSTELRARALSALDKGMKRQEIAELFKVSTRTLYNWDKRRQETGDYACKLPPKERSHRKLTQEKLLNYLASHPDHYLHEIADAFSVKPQSVWSALKKFGISRKKNDPIFRARREREAKTYGPNQADRSR